MYFAFLPPPPYVFLVEIEKVILKKKKIELFKVSPQFFKNIIFTVGLL